MLGASAATNGAHKQVNATFGDCKNSNAGKHNGFDCPSVTTTNSGGDTSGGDVTYVN